MANQNLLFQGQTVPGKFLGGDKSYKSPSEGSESRFHVDRIKNQFRDLARPNLFLVKFSPPPLKFVGVDQTHTSDEIGDLVSGMVKSCSFPSVDIGRVSITRAGTDIHFPGDTKFGDMNITFWADDKMLIRNYFHSWHMTYLNNYPKGTVGEPMAVNSGSIYLEQLDTNYECTYGVHFHYIWPTQIGDIQLSHESEHQREEFQVTFTYSYHEIYGGASQVTNPNSGSYTPPDP